MRRLLLATRNPDKVREILAILEDLEVEILTLQDFPDAPPVREDGQTLEENAIKKACSAFEVTGLPALADDTGLEVDYLGGAPGVLSSRYAGENASYEANRRKLLGALQGVPWQQRAARFRCVVAFVPNNDELWLTEGVCEGLITEEPRGEGGFGYDPIFWVPSYQMTFAEMPPDLKNRISHRAIALRDMKDKIRQVIGK